MTSRSGPVLAALALVAAACGGGTDADGPEPDTNGDTVASPDEAEAQGAGQGGEASGTPGETSDGSTGSSATGGEPLTASFRGVTETSIEVGVALLDSRPFVDNGDVAARFEALAADLNDRGGILGREVELFIDEFGVLDELGFEAVCTRHTEDEQVFVAITFAFSMDLSCYGGLHDTNVINLIEISESDITGSTATVLSVAADPLSSLLAGLDLLADELDGMPIALHVRPEREADLATVRAHVEALGARVVTETVATVYLDDIPADQAQHDVFLERWISDGAEMVVAIGRGASSALIGTIDRAGSDLMVVVQGNEANSLEAFGADLGRMNLVAIAPVSIALVAEQGLYGTTECIDFIESSTGQTIPLSPPVGEPQPLVSTIATCQAMELFELIATTAGPVLTNESWREAVLALESFEMTGTPRAGLGPGRAYAGNPDVALYVYDDDAGFVPRD
jgi:hypothetical protein